MERRVPLVVLCRSLLAGLLQPERLSQPQVENRIVAIGETKAGIDPVEQGVSPVVGGDPGPIRVGDLVIDPYERLPRRPLDECTGSPVQSIAFVLFIDV